MAAYNGLNYVVSDVKYVIENISYTDHWLILYSVV